MRTYFRALFIVSIGIMFPLVVIAAGGGGGGGGAPTGMGNTVIETCTQDVWTCGDWGSCGLNGQQVRTCTKTFDCPSSDTPPSPASVRTCTPECTADEWSCGAWGPCIGRRQRRICTKASDCPGVDTPSPATEVACRFDCGNDVWSCTSWSACAPVGVRTRTCVQRTDCEAPDQPAPKPMEREVCTPARQSISPAPRPTVRRSAPPPASVPTSAPSTTPGVPPLICGNLPTLTERVQCRLGLSEEVLERELQIQYLPEECRALRKDGEGVEGVRDGDACITRYRNLRPCWAKPIGAERLACVRGVLGFQNVRDERATCETKIGGDRLQCLSAFRVRAYPYVTFRFYDLEERAEGLKELGAPLDLVARFVVAAEQGKQDFNAAHTKDERISIIRRVQSEWRTFVAALSDQVKERARSEGIGSSY